MYSCVPLILWAGSFLFNKKIILHLLSLFLLQKLSLVISQFCYYLLGLMGMEMATIPDGRFRLIGTLPSTNLVTCHYLVVICGKLRYKIHERTEHHCCLRTWRGHNDGLIENLSPCLLCDQPIHIWVHMYLPCHLLPGFSFVLVGWSWRLTEELTCGAMCGTIDKGLHGDQPSTNNCTTYSGDFKVHVFYCLNLDY